MEAMQIVSIVGGLIGILVGATALLTYSADKRRAAVTEGQKNQELEQMKRDLADARTRVSCIEGDGRDIELSLTEIKTILQRVVSDVKDLGAKIDEMRRG